MATTIKEFIILLNTTVLLLMYTLTSVTANFSILPTNVTQVEGLNALFFCRHDAALGYTWRVNDELLLDNTSPDISAVPIVPPGDNGTRISQLMITALRGFNESDVECVALTANGQRISASVKLTVQGRLDPVGNMQINAPSSLMTGDIVSVSWDAPFTLNITDTDPDITYCVDIFSTTDWSHVFSECGINDTLYNVSLDNVSGRTCDNFNISVTPVNGAGNGSTSGGIFETLGDINIMGVDLATPECQHMGVAMATNYQVVLQVFIEGSVSTCICQIEIDGSVFNDTNGLICMSSTLMLTTTTSQLPLANFYDLTVTLSNSVGNISASMEIGTDIIESIQTGNSSNNTVELTATFSDSTCLNSTDVFVILADTSISINRSVYSVVRGIGTESNTIEDVSSGQYSVLVYDLGSDGLLRNSPVRPIAKEMVNVSGSTLDNSFLLNTTDSSVSLDIQRDNDTLNITCMYQQDSSLQGCLVIVQFIGTLEEFEQLNLNTLQRSEGNQIQVCLDREGDYLVTGYPTTSRGIVNSSIAHAETISVEFIIPTAVPTVSTMTNDGMDTTSTDVSGTPTPKDKYGPGRNIIIGVVVGVIAVLLVLIIIVALVILIVVKCGKNKFKISKLDFNHSSGLESTIRRPLCDSPIQPDNGIVVSDGEPAVEMSTIVADGETGVITISQAPPNYKDVIDPMYDSVTSPKSKTATKTNGVSPEDIAPYDPKYDSVGPATNNNNTTTPSSAAAAMNTTIQESSADGREAEHDQPKLELDRPDREELVTDASDRDHPCIEAEGTIQHTPGPYTGEPYAVVDKTKITNPEALNTDEGIQHITGPDTGDPYAVLDKSKKPKTDDKPIQHVQGPCTGDMYALVDKLPKRPSTSKRPPPPPPPSEDRIDTQLPPALPERNDTRPVHDADGRDGVSSHPIHDVDHVYDSLVSPPPNSKAKKTSIKLERSTHPYESVSLERDDQRKKSDQVEYKEIDVVPSEKSTDSSLNSTILPGHVDHSLLNTEENDDVDFNVHPREPNTPSRRDGDMDSELGSTRTRVADSAEATSLTSPFSHTTPHLNDHTTETGTSLHHSVPTNYDYSGKTEEEGQFLYTVV